MSGQWGVDFDALLLQAARIDITEDEFWALSPRQLHRRHKAHRLNEEAKAERRNELEDVRFWNTLNAVGWAVTEGVARFWDGKTWEHKEPPEEEVAEPEPARDFEERWAAWEGVEAKMRERAKNQE